MSKIAAQLYTLREYTKTPEGIKDTMHKVSQLGYKAVQLSALGPIDPVKLKEIVDGEGLYICATHNSFERLRDKTQEVIEEHRLWNCKYVGVGSMPAEYRNEGEDGFKRFAREASAVARKLADAGLVFVYHNHSFEFQKFQGRTGLEILYDESDPEVFFSEIDTYWVQHGGGDPAAWIKKLKGRAPVVHFKDMVIGKEGQQLMAEVGEGNLNWPEIIEACNTAGVEWFIVEQDICQRDPFESLGISLKNLKSMGVE